MVIFPYLENIPQETYNIKTALSCIKQLSLDGNRDIAKIEEVIAIIIKKHDTTQEDHDYTLNKMRRKHNDI